MLDLFAFQGGVMLLLTLLVFGLKAFAFVDALTHTAERFVAADKLTKPAWLGILGVFLVAHMLFWEPIGLLSIIGTIAAIVYLVDARPALRSLARR